MKNELSEYTEVEREIQERYVFSQNLFIMHKEMIQRELDLLSMDITLCYTDDTFDEIHWKNY